MQDGDLQLLRMLGRATTPAEGPSLSRPHCHPPACSPAHGSRPTAALGIGQGPARCLSRGRLVLTASWGQPAPLPFGPQAGQQDAASQWYSGGTAVVLEPGFDGLQATPPPEEEAISTFSSFEENPYLPPSESRWVSQSSWGAVVQHSGVGGGWTAALEGEGTELLCCPAGVR